MAGTNPDFDSAAFRTGIQFVFTMAAPPVGADQVKFYFASTLTYNTAHVDGIGVPFDPVSTVTRSQPAAVSVPCGIEYRDGRGDITVFGETVPATVHITLLDEDFAQVNGCAYIVLHGEKYKLIHVDPPSGLFDVGIYELTFEAENAS